MTKFKKIRKLKKRVDFLKMKIDIISRGMGHASWGKLTNKKQNTCSPLSYYKYMSQNVLLRILEYKTIKITNPLKFNDPMDCTFPDIELDDAGVRKTVYKYVGKEHASLLRTFKSEYDGELQDELLKLKNELKRIGCELAKDWNGLIGNYRVLSLTTKADNLLMWSHYADEHKGVVVKFRGSPSFGQPRKVNYFDGPRRLNDFFNSMFSEIVSKETSTVFSEVDSDIAADVTLKIMREYFFMKISDWKYENEYRLAYEADDKRVRNIEDDLDVLNVQDDDIESIVIGSSVSQERAHELKSLIKSSFPNVNVEKFYREGWTLKCKNV